MHPIYLYVCNNFEQWSLCTFILWHVVCETIYHKTEVTESVPICSETLETVCNEDGPNGEEICKDYPKQVCELEEQTATRTTPEIKCHSVDVEVCGPEPCPLTKKEKVCGDEVKEVS